MSNRREAKQAMSRAPAMEMVLTAEGIGPDLCVPRRRRVMWTKTSVQAFRRRVGTMWPLPISGKGSPCPLSIGQ
jgi:hypothetical protein